MISAPVFRGFRKVMPPMSRTEKEAIDAGTTLVGRRSVPGKPDWKKLHNYPQPQLTAEEQAFLDGPVEEACRMANDFQITHELADLPPELWAYLKEHRFFAMIIKKSTADWSSPLMRSPVYCKNCPASPGFWLSPSAFQTHSAPASCCSTMVRKSRRITICRDWRAARDPPALR